MTSSGGSGGEAAHPQEGGGYWHWPVPQGGELTTVWMERLRRAGLLSPLLSGRGGGGRPGED